MAICMQNLQFTISKKYAISNFHNAFSRPGYLATISMKNAVATPKPRGMEATLAEQALAAILFKLEGLQNDVAKVNTRIEDLKRKLR